MFSIRALIAPTTVSGKAMLVVAIAKDGMMLLISAAVVTSGFRIVSTVTILQQNVGVETLTTPTETGRRGTRAENRRFVHLPKSWATAGAFSHLTPGSKLAHY
jgi:hypothetical protein